MRRAATLVGITCDLQDAAPGERAFFYTPYADAVARAGGLPLALSPNPSLAARYAESLDAFVLTGGDDPRTERWGIPTHPSATPMHPRRQEFELALLDALDSVPRVPVLGVCLGMQLMALHAGGTLNQRMSDTLPTADQHWDHEHEVAPVPGEVLVLGGMVRSRHRQSVEGPGRMRIAASARDGVIEAIVDPSSSFRLGVQWHPERTGDPRVGQGLFDALVRAVRESR